MAAKLARSTFPSGHGPSDFECFGPPATKDGEFEGTRISDMGCFMQRDDGEAKTARKAVDSNKYYHAACVKSKSDGTWYVYVEYGREGAGKPQFQFIECSGEAEAEREYIKVCMSKNVKRGKWEDHKVLGRRLIPKSTKQDLYLVRALAARSTGLPDAKSIKCDEGAKKPVKRTTKKKKSTVTADSPTTDLMRSLNVATVKYAKGSMANDTIPTQSTLDKGRDILAHAIDRVASIGDDLSAQVRDRELKQLTRDMYSMIPKKKDRGAPPEDWILNQQNIRMWQDDMDAFESALYTVDFGDIENDPFGGMKITMRHLPTSDVAGEFVHGWMPDATRNVHGWVGKMKIRNVWLVDRHGDDKKFTAAQNRIIGNKPRIGHRALHQPKRGDLGRVDAKRAVASNTALLFHGTRSVNVSGILRESLRMPRMLKGVHITGAMFGPGIYWADDWKKSAGYTSLRGSIYSSGSGVVPGRGAFMFVAEVALGSPYLADGPGGWTVPPRGHHCVFGKGGHSAVQNNEWIVYNSEQNRLRYLVEFETARR